MATSRHGMHSATAGWVDGKNCRKLLLCSHAVSLRAYLPFVFLFFICINTSFAAKNIPVIVIANKNISEKTLTLGAVRSIFGMRLRSWNGGKPIRVFVFNDHHPLHIQFSKKILGVFPHQLRWSWDRLVFSGTGQAPTYVKTESEMLEYVKNTPGAIGYITGGQDHGHVKELPVIKD